MNHEAFRAALIGETVHRLVVQEHWHEEHMSDQFNVLFVLVDDHWLRFFIDAGVFFCRVVSAPNPPLDEDGHKYPLVKYPFAGTVQDVVFSFSPNAASLHIILSDGSRLFLHNKADHSTVTFQTPNP